MEPPELTAATTLYLCATSWLPLREGEDTVVVPGGRTAAIDTAANLLHTAMWDLRRQGVFDFEQLRPVEDEKIEVPRRVNIGLTIGVGVPQSSARFEFLDPGVDLPGLEGELIKAARSVRDVPPSGFINRVLARGNQDDERGVRRLVGRMNLYSADPWQTAVDYCLGEAKAAGLVEVVTRWFYMQEVRIVDQAAVDSLRERTDELRAARRADLERAPDLHDAVIADLIGALEDAHRPQASPG
jgi:hypothetical protein